jgi:hypothetical protein
MHASYRENKSSVVQTRAIATPMWKKRMHTAHSINHLRYSQMDDEARQGKRLR